MKATLPIEELFMLALGIYAFSFLNLSWWFLGLFLVPDIGMVGYLFGNRVGAFTYKLFHNKGLAILIWIYGFAMQEQVFQLIGVILFSHSAFDRILGYGLKYKNGFKFTHLGEIGK